MAIEDIHSVKTDSRLARGLKLYFSSAVIYGLGILLFRSLSYYQKTLGARTQETLLYLYLAYLVLAPIIYLFTIREYSENKPFLIFKAVQRLVVGKLKEQKEPFLLEPEEKIAFLFILVKLFYMPTMTEFFYGNLNNLSSYWQNFSWSIHWFPIFFILMFTADTLIFAIGYAFESRKFGNFVRSVEPTFFGWFVTLICYPPFNSLAGNYIPWGANDYVSFWNPTLTLIFRIVLTLLLIIYTWASLALGLKASNLTNRGIVTKFPYSIIRHPAYVGKNLIWWISLLPVMSWPFFFGMLFWSTIYYFRAVTEERHLGKDPDYVQYCEKVKWRFVPGLI